MPEQTQTLQRILALSRTMREHALDADWERVQLLEAERRELIACCFPLDADAGAAAVDALHEILELDKSVLSLANVTRQDIGERLGKLKLGRQASAAYADVSPAG